MKKRFIFLLVAMIGMTLQSMGQTKVIVPRFQKFVMVDAGVNIRKAPSASSQRLIEYYNSEDEGGESSGVTVKWEEVKDRRYKPKAVNAEAVPVIGEVGEWYKVYYSNGYDWGGESFSGIAYIAKKFCHDAEVTPVPFTPSRKTQKYKNYYIEVDDGGGDLVLHLGKYVDGLLVRLQAVNWVGYDEIEKIKDKENPTDAEIQHLLTLFKKKAISITFRVKGVEHDIKMNLDEYTGPTIEM